MTSSATEQDESIPPLNSMFWGGFDCGQIVVRVGLPRFATYYGPFFNDAVARYWVDDNFPNQPYRVIALSIPRDPREKS